jgi:hypothetical protein
MHQRFDETWLGSSADEISAMLRRIADDVQHASRGVIIEPSVAIAKWDFAHRAVPCLVGTASGHPTIGDGKSMVTSQLFYFDRAAGIARTMSRWYRLADPARSPLTN